MELSYEQTKKQLSQIILQFDEPVETKTKEVLWKDSGEKKATFTGFKARDVSTRNGRKFPGARIWVYVDTGFKTEDGKSAVADLKYRFTNDTPKKVPLKKEDVTSTSKKLHPIISLYEVENWQYEIYGAVNNDWHFADSTNPQAIIVFQEKGRKIYPTRFVSFWGNETIHLNTPGFADQTMAVLL